tara:strand:+ start:1079 stop:1342 length:264 start_codon:yes stop_codon:yes gene_type:complete
MYIVYGKTLCAYCEHAVRYLRAKSCDFTYRCMDKHLDQLTELSTTYNWRTVPLIVQVVDGEEHFVGGYDDLVERFQNKTPEKNDKQD